MNETEYLIIGGGPTGLGAATRLQERGLPWHLLEAADDFGGLASTHVDEQGFLWDFGGHVQFSHYDTFDRYMDLALGKDGWLAHQRECWVWIRRRFVPYPFQNNLHRLDAQDRWSCVQGLLEAAQRVDHASPKNFEEWMFATFGPGITELFLMPYNFKVWAAPPSAMDHGWIGERVAVPKLGSVLKSICTGQDEISWGPNRAFKFPLRGGTGAIWRSIGRMLPRACVSFGQAVQRIDVARNVAHTAAGESWKYRQLFSTMPLNKLIEVTPGVVDPATAGRLIYSSTSIVGVGLKGTAPDHLKAKSWIYFPENNSPYYRVTVFSNYSPHNVPHPGEEWSLMTETSGSSTKPVRQESLAEEALLALEEDGLLPDRGSICSVTQFHLPQGYPTPFLGRDGIVDPLLRAFEAKGIFSRGRFGAWKYEVANQDHSFAQGYECVDRLSRKGGPELEPTLFLPGLVNSRRNP